MVGAIFHYYDQLEDGLGSPKYYFEALLYSLRNLGVTHLLCIDTSTFKIPERFKNYDSQIEFITFRSLQDAIKAFPKSKFVYLENQWTIDREKNLKGTDLCEFKHPKNPIYVVGPDKGVYVPLTTKFVVLGKVNDLIAEDALKIILYNRLNKL